MATSQASPGSPDISRILQFLILRPGGPRQSTWPMAVNLQQARLQFTFVRSIGNPEIQNHPWNITCEINLETTNSDWKNQIWIYIYIIYAIITCEQNAIETKRMVPQCLQSKRSSPSVEEFLLACPGTKEHNAMPAYWDSTGNHRDIFKYTGYKSVQCLPWHWRCWCLLMDAHM